MGTIREMYIKCNKKM